MPTFDLITNHGAVLRRETPSESGQPLRENSLLKSILEAEVWFQQHPRTSFEIACMLSGGKRCGMSDVEITMHDMLPELQAAGYTALGSNGSDLADCVWGKA